LALYRQADRILVEEEVILIPLRHGVKATSTLIHPWVKDFHKNAMGDVKLHHIRLEREN
jgi:hypothetical protein